MPPPNRNSSTIPPENAAEWPAVPLAAIEPGPIGAAPEKEAPDVPRAGTAVTTRDVLRTWWPLAASWLCMGLELPVVSAVMARLPDPTLSLAAYGGVVFPLALLIESPIVMLLSASTALSRDLPSHRLVQRFMWTTSLGLTALHVLIAFTPLFDVVVGDLLGAPLATRGPARIGLMIMIPWTLSIAFRRTQQGLLIRSGRTKLVGAGTAVRLSVLVFVLLLGSLYGRLPGIVVGTLAVTGSVMAEALFAGLAARPIERALATAPQVKPALTQKRFLAFYVPLLLTPLIGFLTMPLTSAAMSRMPLALESLAAWPALSGLVFTLRSVGFALNEVVVALLERTGAAPVLRRFAYMLAAITSGLLVVLAVTPLGYIWLSRVAGLDPALVDLAVVGLALLVVAPGSSAIQSLYQGALVHAHRTRGITESVAVLLVVTAAGLALGGLLTRAPALFVGMSAFAAGIVAQTLWLGYRAGQVRRSQLSAARA